MNKQELDESAKRVAYLIVGYVRKTLTESEHDELDRWVEESDENAELTDEKNIEAMMELIKQTRFN